MKTPEEKLCSRGWRISRSSWLLLSILSFGFLTWAGFAIIGIKLRRKIWIVSAVGWFVLGIALSMVMGSIDTGTKENPIVTPASTAMGWAFFAFWAAGITHSALCNRAWLRGLAYAKAPVAWYATGIPNQDGLQQVQGGAGPARSLDDALRWQNPSAAWPQAQPLLADRSDSFGHPVVQRPAEPLTLDINAASSADFQRELGFDQAWGDWLVSTRNRIGGYTNSVQLLTEAQVPPHLFAAFRHRIVAEGAPNAGVPSTNRRRLDL